MKKLFGLLALLFLFTPIASLAQNNTLPSPETQFAAKIIEVTEDFIKVEDKDKQKFTVETMDVMAVGHKFYKGDQVLVNELSMIDGENRYIITDVVRKKTIYYIIGFFILLVLLLYKKQGWRALLSLFFSFLVIIFIIAPLILQGKNPLLVTISGASLILLLMMYLTYGFNKKTHSALIGIITSLVIGGFLAYLFVHLASLSGFVQEEASFIISLGYEQVDMRGLLLAAIIIGMLGVLDDMAINQASAVNELISLDKNLTAKELYKKAMQIGKDHISSMINTLLFAYIGAAFPLFLLFVIKQPPFDTFGGVLNNEIVATEIIRILAGSSALLLAAPITTWIAVKMIKK